MDKVFKTLGASNKAQSEREALDFYATDPIAVDLLERNFSVPQYIWEPACGSGCLSRRLEDYGHEVFSSDIADRGFGERIDFLATDTMPAMSEHENFAILTNPPFEKLTEFVEKGLEVLKHGQYLILFLRTLALESRVRYERIYRHTPPMLLMQCIDRVLCAKGGNFYDARNKLGKGAQAYAWYVWQKGNYKRTQLTWI